MGKVRHEASLTRLEQDCTPEVLVLCRRLVVHYVWLEPLAGSGSCIEAVFAVFPSAGSLPKKEIRRLMGENDAEKVLGEGLGKFSLVHVGFVDLRPFSCANGAR